MTFFEYHNIYNKNQIMEFSWGTVNTDTWFTNIIDVLFIGLISFLISLFFYKGIYKMERFLKFCIHHFITYGGLIFQFILIQNFESSIRTLGYTQFPLVIEKIIFFIFHIVVCYIWLFLSWSFLKCRVNKISNSFWIIQIVFVFVVAVNSLLNLMPTFFNHSERIFPRDIPSLIYFYFC